MEKIKNENHRFFQNEIYKVEKLQVPTRPYIGRRLKYTAPDKQ